jgi:hypothetical protein
LDVFKHTETLGIPLELIIDHIKENNCVVNWLEFLTVSIEHGWNIKSTITKIEYALVDVYDKVYANEVISRLKQLITFN